MNTPADSLLGKETPYPKTYDPGLLFPIPRRAGRQVLGIDSASLPFHGVDIWNAYELSWLDLDGRPRLALANFRIPASSPNLVESKSFKLYLGSFASCRLPDDDTVRRMLQKDLSVVAGAAVDVELLAPEEVTDAGIGTLIGHCIDDTPVSIQHYGPPNPDLLVLEEGDAEEVLVSHVLKSNCPVTGQPDWASVQIAYRGPRIQRAGLLRYLVSFREHAEFHEQCVERIFCDLMRHCKPSHLTVYARYTRRGGLDINPWRSTGPGQPDNPRLARQ